MKPITTLVTHGVRSMPKLQETRKAWVPAIVGVLSSLQGVPVAPLFGADPVLVNNLITILLMALTTYMTPNAPLKGAN